MSAGNLIRIALGLINFVGWLTTKINQAEWQRQGYDKALAEAIAQLQKNSGIAEKAFNDARKATDAELDEELAS